MKFIDLFAGIGGFRLGMEMAGHKPAGWCEIDKFAQRSYKAMYDTKGEWFADDIRTIEPRDMPEFDCITGGFPCQSFSVAGKRGGFEDTRGTLFFEIARIIRERQPKPVFLENVKGLLNHDGGRTFGTILNTFWELGYDVEWQLLNSKDFGVPQNRERVFVIGYPRETSRRKIFPITGTNEKTISQIGNIVSTGNWDNPQRGRIYSPEGICPTLNCMQGGGLEPKVALLNGTKEGNAYCLDANYSKGETRLEKSKRSMVKVKHGVMIQRGRGYNKGGLHEIVPTLTKNSYEHNDYSNDDVRIRKLTPKECFRLQGFPDELFEKAREVNSDNQLYKQAGNAVTVNVIYEIARRL